MNKNKRINYVHIRERAFLDANSHWDTKGTFSVSDADLQRYIQNLRTNYTGVELPNQTAIGAKQYPISYSQRPQEVIGEVVKYNLPDKRVAGATSISLDIYADSNAHVLEIYKILSANRDNLPQ